MAYDANAVLQTLVTKTATFQSAGYDLKTSTPRRGMVARFLLTNYQSTVSPGTTFTCSIEQSSDNTTYSTLASSPTLTGGTATASKVVHVPFVTFPVQGRYIRAVMTVVSAATSTNSVSYVVDLGIAASGGN